MSRYFSALSPPPSPANPYEELLSSLSRINTFNPPVQTCSTGWTFHGFYAGPTSIAFLFYRLSQLYPNLQFKSQSLLDWSHAYLELGSHFLNPKRLPVDPSHCGIANETLSQLALRSIFTSDPSLALQLCSHSSLINTSEDDGSNEWLYGRAGYLYLLRLVLKFTPDPSDTFSKRVNDTITTTANRILASPLPWKWHHKPYLGAVHGSVGILVQILLSSPPSEIPKLTTQLKPILLSILSEQLPSGNFPSSHSTHLHRQVSRGRDDRLVQFCHGSPGVLLSLFSIKPFFTEPEVTAKIDTAIANAQGDLLARGLLTKAPCLCHGVPTNALALTSNEKMMQYVSHMSTGVLEGEIGQRLGWMSEAGHRDEFASLYTGEAGRAWVWAIVDQIRKAQRGESVEGGRGIIGFNDV